MGFYDYVTVRVADPQSGIEAGAKFQTKNLYNYDGEFTITPAGQLVEHVYRLEERPNAMATLVNTQFRHRVHVEDKVLAFHGDLLMHCSAGDGSSRELVARFTHGQLEWIRDSSQYPKDSLELLLEQGAR